ncbi:hypothetical protein [Enterococcus sp. LJL51]|uniref:hypothetical protein n=1 Tax=Enterococcus sp. LJL51 TaxID=3416656 RepID=UPI003CEDFBFA
MKINYHLQLQDWLEISAVFQKISPKNKRSMLIRLALIIIITCMMFVFVMNRDYILALSYLALASLLLFATFFLPKKRAVNYYNNPENRHIFDSLEMTIDETGVTCGAETAHSFSD